jgi:putative hydrolase of the HAD superfamily
MIVFFDLDDTLIDSRGAVDEAVRKVHRDLQVKQSLGDFLDAWRAAHTHRYPRYLNGHLSYNDVSRMRVRDVLGAELTDSEADAVFERYMNAYESNWALFADVRPCLRNLRGLSLGVISNGPSNEQRRKLTQLGIEPAFELILISEECGYAKPNAAIFARACELANVAAHDAWYVGDSFEVDYRGATAAGLRAVWLNRRGEKPRTDSRAITSLAQVPDVIASG